MISHDNAFRCNIYRMPRSKKKPAHQNNGPGGNRNDAESDVHTDKFPGEALSGEAKTRPLLKRALTERNIARTSNYRAPICPCLQSLFHDCPDANRASKVMCCSLFCRCARSPFIRLDAY